MEELTISSSLQNSDGKITVKSMAEPITVYCDVSNSINWGKEYKEDAAAMNDMKKKCENIIKIWYNNRKRDIDMELKEKERELINNDECVKILKEAQERIRKILEEEKENKVDVIFIYKEYTTNKTDKKIIFAREEYSKKYFKLENTKKELEAMLELAETYEQAIEILRIFGIINKDGRLID